MIWLTEGIDTAMILVRYYQNPYAVTIAPTGHPEAQGGSLTRNAMPLPRQATPHWPSVGGPAPARA